MKYFKDSILTLSIAAFWDFYDKMTKKGYTLCSSGARGTGKNITYYGNYRKLQNYEK